MQMQEMSDGMVDMSIAFYSKKMNTVQQNYSIGEKELLAIVETLRVFRALLLGQQLEIFTDH